MTRDPVIEMASRSWRLLVAATLGIVALLVLPADIFADVTQELIAFFGLIMAAVLPTMILTATVLRAGGLSAKQIVSYRDALIRQVKLWAGLFLLSIIACASVVIGKMLHWTLKVEIPDIGKFSFDPIETIYVINAIIVAMLFLLGVRALSIVQGIASLIRLSSEIALSEAKVRDEPKFQELEKSVADMPNREGFGRQVH